MEKALLALTRDMEEKMQRNNAGENQQVLSHRIQAATVKRIQQYEQLKGKHIGDFPFWDIIVIGSADKVQKISYELQLEEKLATDQLPLGVDYCVVADPGTVKIGGGGSMMAILQCLKEIYQEELETKKVLVIPAGGYSQRLPNASLLGKMFLSVPIGSPPYQMLDLKLALAIDFPAKMPAGIFLMPCDCIEVYDDDLETWSFDSWGVTALGHPSTINIGTGHGVFLIPPQSADSPCVEVVQAQEFLHKPSIDEMSEKGAILTKGFCSGIYEEGEMVLTDSSYFMDFNTAFKLLDLYNDESPLRCEIDCHGDFLQPLGPQASSAYIQNTSNVSEVTKTLTSMREKIFDTLKGTQLNVVVMRYSRFYHMGTTNEYLDHICNVTPLAKEIGLDVYVPHNSNGELVGASPCKISRERDALACVMNSICPEQFKIADRSLVEHCEFKSPIEVHRNSIVSSCTVGPTADGSPVIIPQNSFFHTAAVSDGMNKKQYVTVSFGIEDDLKKEVSPNKVGELSILGKSFNDTFGLTLKQTQGFLFPDGSKRTLWHARLFQVKDSMEDAFTSTLALVQSILNLTPLQSSPSVWEGRVSMADLIVTKDVIAMHYFRQKLTEQLLSTNK